MYNISFAQNTATAALYSDFIKAPKPNTAPKINYQTQFQTNNNQNSDSQDSFIKKTKKWLLEPIENPDYRKGKLGATPYTTRLSKYGGYVMLALFYGSMFYFLHKQYNMVSKRFDETQKNFLNIGNKNNPASFLEKYKEDLGNAPRLRDLALPDVLKGTVNRLMNKIKDPESFIQKGGISRNTILLYGPPGTGKTTVAKAIAKEIENAELFSVDLSTIQGMYVGQSEAKLDKVIRNICQYAKENPLKKVFVLMDEFDSIAIKDNGSANQQYHASLLNVLKRAISEKLTQHDNIVLIATTNAELNKAQSSNWVQVLDSAIADRFGEKIRVDNPTTEQFKKAIVHHYSGLKRVSDSLKDRTSEDVAKIAQQLNDNNCSFRTLENLFNASAAQSEGKKLSVSDVLSALPVCIEESKKAGQSSKLKIGFY